MSLVSSTALLVATLDLQLTRSVVGAIRTADLESARELGNPQSRGVDQFEPRQKLHPTASYGPVASGTVLHASTKILPREVIRPTPTVEAGPAQGEHPHHVESFMIPPWKKLPYPEKIPAHSKIKRITHQPDIPHKGTMIDFFC